MLPLTSTFIAGFCQLLQQIVSAGEQVLTNSSGGAYVVLKIIMLLMFDSLQQCLVQRLLESVKTFHTLWQSLH